MINQKKKGQSDPLLCSFLHNMILNQGYKYSILFLFAGLLLSCSLGDIFSNNESGIQTGGEIWASDDGLSWVSVTENAAFGVRSRASAVVFEDRLWVIGGAREQYSMEIIQRYDDVWRSEDGNTWIKIRNNQESEGLSCSDCPVNMKGSHLAFAFMDKMWLYGIPPDYSEYHSFFSEDGANWTKLDSVPQQGFILGHTVFKDTLWAISVPGFQGESGENRVWFSTDGRQWSKISPIPGFSPCPSFHLTVFNNQLWLLNSDRKETWYSSDGMTWQMATDSLQTEPLESFDFVAFKKKLWIFGHPTYDYEKNEYISNIIWYSEDGTNWTRVQESPEFGPRRGHAITIFQDRLWIIGGLERY
ncbi:hypothetical protein ACFL5V_03990 [Fibrobacterota bacterium]